MVEDGGEEDEEELSGGEEADLRSSSGRGSLLTRRGITLRVLLKDGLVEPGDGVLAIHYLVSAHNNRVESDASSIMFLTCHDVVLACDSSDSQNTHLPWPHCLSSMSGEELCRRPAD